MPTFSAGPMDFAQLNAVAGPSSHMALNDETFDSLAGMVDVASFWLQTDLDDSGFWTAGA